MKALTATTGAGYRVHPITAAHKVGDRPHNRDDSSKRRLTREEMELEDGIKAQHAAAAFIIAYLETLKSGWRAEETEVGGDYDRQGFDLLLIEIKTKRVIPVDFSFASKDGGAVQYQRDWFVMNVDGPWVFRKECAQLLIRQFIKVMSENQHFRRA
ncbi:MAG TPA: hypothetical protein PL112_17300 [Candidatus Obscuribacter sp.]|nr:hypothetical protein [Candidatus Obscuribacter sp.]HMY51484.1 hypothetical protein [Candidatus Obscuribacter sp.]HND68563.1 hypothetical protein [Candidatus Obscuribacter sp.]